MLKPVWPIWAAVSCLLFCSWPALARPGAAIEESRPSIYFLPDKNGNLQPVLGFKYEEFSELYQLKNHLGTPERLPQFSIERISASGTAADAHAELSVKFQILIRDDGWVRTPLRLDQALLRGDVQYRGPGEHLVDFEGERAGYVCWLHGKPGSRHEITLTMLAPLETVGDETKLNLSFPRAAAAELKLSVPLAAASATVSQGAALLPAAGKRDATDDAGNRPHRDAQTELNVVGLPADFQLTWRKSKPRREEATPVIEAAGNVLTRLDGRGISTDATLTVRSLTSPFDRFTVRLPAGADLSPGSHVEQVVNSPRGEKIAGHLIGLPDDQRNGAGPSQRSIEVRLAAKTTGPVEVRLECRRDCDTSRRGSWNELAGFEVIGAARESGTIALAVGDDWQLLFGPVRQVRSLDSVPDALRKDNNHVVASFEYFGQPYSLPVRLAVRPPRLSVSSQYVLSIDREQVRLEGRLTYDIAGAKLSTLDLAMPGWQIDEIDTGDLASSGEPIGQADTLQHRAAVVAGQSGELSVSLGHPSSGAVELHLRARRPIPSGVGSLAIPLPNPRADSVGLLALAVVPSDTVELTPDRRAIEGLEATDAAPAMELPPREQSPFFYRGTGGPATFAARLRALPPQTDTDASPGSIIVDRAWFQSCLSSAAREDRATFRLITNRALVDVLLPADADATQADVTVDGVQVDPRLAPENRLIVPLSGHRQRPRERTAAAERNRCHVVELRYHFRGPRPAAGPLSFAFPRLEPDAWMRRIYWQLVLPANEHLVTNPGGLTGEFVWGWDGYFWGRNPLLDETQLEPWVGATARGPLPDRANRYLFSSFGRLDRADVRTASRTWIVLLASGVVLALGLLLIRVPAARHPATLLVVAIALLAAGLIAPEPTLLLAQAASLGLGLVLLAAILERGVARRRRRKATPKELSGLRIEVASNLPNPSTYMPTTNPPSTETLLPSAQPPGDIAP